MYLARGGDHAAADSDSLSEYKIADDDTFQRSCS
jgi:hypothetical protein